MVREFYFFEQDYSNLASCVGSYVGAGYLNINRNASGKITNYARWLDMDKGVLRTSWTEPSSAFDR